MKHLLLVALIFFTISCSDSNGDEISSSSILLEEMSNIEHQNLLLELNTQIEDILIDFKPIKTDMASFKLDVISGKYELPESTLNKLTSALEPLENYGRAVSESIGSTDSRIEEYYSLGIFKPEDKFSSTYFSESFEDLRDTRKLDGSDFLRCGAVAIGADALWALGGSSASAWSRAAMKKAFTAVAKRFLGPIGVAIAAVSFGVCLASV